MKRKAINQQKTDMFANTYMLVTLVMAVLVVANVNYKRNLREK